MLSAKLVGHRGTWTECIKVSALNKVFCYMCDIAQQERSKWFKVKDLENMFIDLLKCYRIRLNVMCHDLQNRFTTETLI